MVGVPIATTNSMMHSVAPSAVGHVVVGNGRVTDPFANIDQPSIAESPPSPLMETFTNVFSSVTRSSFTVAVTPAICTVVPIAKRSGGVVESSDAWNSFTVPATTIKIPQIRLARMSLRVLTALSVR